MTHVREEVALRAIGNGCRFNSGSQCLRHLTLGFDVACRSGKCRAACEALTRRRCTNAEPAILAIPTLQADFHIEHGAVGDVDQPVPLEARLIFGMENSREDVGVVRQLTRGVPEQLSKTRGEPRSVGRDFLFPDAILGCHARRDRGAPALRAIQ